jgi:hypothetical protein
VLLCTHATTGKQKHTSLFLGEYGCCTTNLTDSYSDTGALILVAGILSFFFARSLSTCRIGCTSFSSTHLLADSSTFSLDQSPSKAPFTFGLTLVFRFDDRSGRTCLRLDQNKVGGSPRMSTLPSNTPPADHTLIPSPHPLYTFIYVSHLILSGITMLASANKRRLVRNGYPWQYFTSEA